MNLRLSLRLRRVLFTVLLLLIPAIALAAEPVQMGRPDISIWDILLTPKYGLFLLFIVVGSALIWTGNLKRPVRIALMALAFVLFGGIVISVHPSPVCATTKPFLYGLQMPFLGMLIFVGAATLLVNKSFCGTACPGGALQEFLFWLPIVKKGPRYRKIPFKVSNTVRISVIALFLIVVTAFSFPLFEYINYFEIFHWTLPASTVFLITLGIVAIGFSALALFYYRPFCYLLCPMGFLTWVLEQFSLVRVRVDASCTSCGICVVKSPCPSIVGIMEGNKIRGDCHLCGECLTTCPENCLSFGIRGKTAGA